MGFGKKSILVKREFAHHRISQKFLSQWVVMNVTNCFYFRTQRWRVHSRCTLHTERQTPSARGGMFAQHAESNRSFIVPILQNFVMKWAGWLKTESFMSD